MSSAQVTISELDLSTRVPSFPGLYIGMVLPDPKKGSVNIATLNTTDTQFLSRYTPDNKVGVGFDNAYFSALAVLQSSNKLWVVGANTAGILWAGATIASASGSGQNASLTVGVADPTAYTFAGESLLISGSSPRAWANDIRVQVINYKTPETVTVSNTGLITVAQRWGTGFPVRLTTTGTLPTGVSTTLTYYVINVSDTTIKLAASLSDAVAQTPVPIVFDGTTGSGTIGIRALTDATKIANTFVVNVYKKTNLNSPIESFTCSKTPGAKDGFGRNIYVQDAVASSNFINVIDNPLVVDLDVKDQYVPIALAGGSDGSASTDGDCIQALDILSNVQSYPVTLIIDGGRATASYHESIISICETRMDCMGILSTPFELEDSNEYLTSVVNYRTTTLNANSSYAALYSSHVLIYDKYNDRDIYVSPDGFVAGLISQTAANFEMWWPAAGFRRGVMNVKDVRRRWTKGEMDYLYDNNINPIRFAVGRGIVLWGQKNLQAAESTLNRVNVRLLLISIESSLRVALENYIFEINDEDTRLEVTTMINASMSDYKTRRGIYAYQTICDASNNSQDDLTIMNVDLIITPSQSVEDIPVTIAIPTNSADFTVTVNSLI